MAGGTIDEHDEMKVRPERLGFACFRAFACFRGREESPARLRGFAGAVLALVAAVAVAVPATGADNAGFALAPDDASIAMDARDLPALLAGERAAAVRPLLETLAGRDAIATFDLLASRARSGSETVAREIFGGRVAFFVAEGSGGWMLGIEADDERCARVLRVLGARLVEPGRFEAPREKLHMRRTGGWLLVAPSATDAAAFERAAARVADEAAEGSLLGAPLVQGLLDSDAPVRVFARHAPPLGGATTLAVRRASRGLAVELDGRYDEPPGLLGEGRAALDPRVVRALEDRAALVVASPSSGRIGAGDAFYLALIPELMPSPALRSNLSGDRILAVGACRTHAMPALAFAWRVEDAEQARVDQDLFMRGVCCGVTRALRPPARSDPEGAVETVADRLQGADPAAPEGRRHADLGPFLDRYFGSPLKLGPSVLCWETVATPCGGWQVYASDVEWLGLVTERLAAASCGSEPPATATGIGFCDGARAAELIRRWRPFATDAPGDRASVGLGAIANAFERIGRIRFQYERPSVNRVRALLEVEPLGTLGVEPRAADMVRPTPPDRPAGAP